MTRPIRLILASLLLLALRPACGREVLPIDSTLPGEILALVEFEGRALAEHRARLVELGVELVAYHPEDAFLVRLPRALVERVADETYVARIGALPVARRVDPRLEGWVAGSGREGSEAARRVRLVLATRKEPVVEDLLSRLAGLGAREVQGPGRGRIIEATLTPDAARDLLDHSALMGLGAWSPSELDVDLSREVGGAVELENIEGYCGQGIRGEVMDAGLHASHPDFDGVLLHGPHDEMSHGTNVYGIVFGNGARDGDGNADAAGWLACAEQGIFADKDELVDRDAHTAELLAHPYRALFQTNSWGNATTTEYDSYSWELDDIAFRHDVAILHSQSNTGNRESRPQAWSKNVISVGGVRHGNDTLSGNDYWGGSASIGPAADGRQKPDVAHWNDHILTTTANGYRPDFNGTSSATPLAAGTLGILLQMWSENAWGNAPEGADAFERRPHALTSKALLIDAAENYAFSGSDDELSRAKQGWGRPSVARAHARAGRSLVVDMEVPLEEGERALYEVEVLQGESELAVTLTWPDPPAAFGAATQRVNDLDLVLRAPDGSVYRGNHGLDVGTASLAGGSADAIDTVERVVLPFPLSGFWTVEVVASAINAEGWPSTPEDDAAFALVVSGATGAAVCPGGVAPAGLVADDSQEGRVALSWQAAPDASHYRVYRSSEGCGGSLRFVATSPTASYVDEPVSGGLSYGYVVRAVNACGGVSEVSECEGALPSGPCIDPPLFDGLRSAAALEEEACGIELQWNAALPLCGGGARYAIHRSLDPDFLPGPATRVASCVAGSSWVDRNVTDGVDYSYVVRALDVPGGADCDAGLSEGNLVRRAARAQGPETLVYGEGFEGLGTWSLEGEFEIGAPQGLGGSALGGADPSVAYAGSGVLGVDLSGIGSYAGNYENSSEHTATGPLFDPAGADSLVLRFQRWLGVEKSPSDRAWIELWNGTAWTTVWENPASTLSDRSWGLEEIDVTGLLAGAPEGRLRIRLSAGLFFVYSGWNLDEIAVVEPGRCESATGPPPVPDGRAVPGEAMRARKGMGSATIISWDVTRCPAPVTHLSWGRESGLSTLTHEDSICALDPSGEADVVLPEPAPGSLIWWTLAGAEGESESLHGFASSGAARDASGIGRCGIAEQDASGTCG